MGKTRIFVAPVSGVSEHKCALRQLTVYSNQVMLAEEGAPTAMILPFPVAAATRAREPVDCGLLVYDMPDRTENFFEALEAVPMEMEFFHMTKGFSRPAPCLPVHKAGAYRYSIVPSVPDFALVNDAVFRLPLDSELYSLLARHYGDGRFAFVVCVIDATATLRPFAYEHDRLSIDKLFVPTRHFHPSLGKEDAGPEGAALRTSVVAAAPEESVADWDHKIFSLGAKLDKHWCWYNVRQSIAALSEKALQDCMDAKGVTALPFALPAMHARQLKMVPLLGSKPNVDLELLLQQPSTAASAVLQPPANSVAAGQKPGGKEEEEASSDLITEHAGGLAKRQRIA